MRKIQLVAVLFIIAGAFAVANADVKLPAVIGDTMVLQQGMAVPIWGWAAPGEQVTVAIAGQKQRATAGDDGRWMVKLVPMKAGGPLEMTIAGKNTITLKNVMAGEVWVCSGQSNMWFRVHSLKNATDEQAQANHPRIRLFTVPDTVALEPLKDTDSRWFECTPETAIDFSAVAYLFGRDLETDLDVPVGLVLTCWGGSQAHMWMSLDLLKSDPEFQPYLDRLAKTAAMPASETSQAEYETKLAAWKKQTGGERDHKDPGISGAAAGWPAPELDTADWEPMELPENFEKRGLLIDGAVWFRKEVEIPQAWQGKDLLLHIGPVDDFDTTFFNGTKVGSIGKETPLFWDVPREYAVPAKLVKPGRNVVAVRVFDHFGSGGILPDIRKVEPKWYRVPMFISTGKPADLAAVSQDAGTVILDGQWKYKVELELVQMPVPPLQPSLVPSGLFNGMIAPIVPYGIRGVLWYQGESNRDFAYEYRRHFPMMIKDWRRAWGQGDFPFMFVQLPNYLPPKAEPEECMQAELREAQLMTLKSVPNTGMAVTIDVGEANDIHPANKHDVARRLLLVAEALVYGKDVVYSGPMYDSMKVEGGKIRLTFKQLGGGLAATGGAALRGFAIAGDDRKFVWATAEIDGDTVVVSSDKVQQPVAVRYAWADSPECNLYNKAGLPASPFRTDDWPGITAKKRMAETLRR